MFPRIPPVVKQMLILGAMTGLVVGIWFISKPQEKYVEEGHTQYERGKDTRHQSRMDDNLPIKPVQKLPDLIIIGSKKCGTGAVKSFLKLNPHFAVQTKETHFFDQDRYEMGREHYRKMMVWSYPNQTTVEGSPRYMYTSFVPGRVKETLPTVKLAAILCDPVRRVLSDYSHLRAMTPNVIRGIRTGRKTLEPQSIEMIKQHGLYLPFKRIVFKDNGELNSEYRAISNGLYAQHLRNWLKFFPKERIHIIDASVFLKAPWVELNKLAEFVGVPPLLSEENFVFDREKGFYCRLKKDGGCLGEGKGREHPEISEEQLEKIREFYEPINEELFQLIGRRLQWG